MTLSKETKNRTKIQKISHIDFNFDTNSFKQMKELTKETGATGIEKGGVLCRDWSKDRIFLRGKCSGTTCEVTMRGKDLQCNENEFPIGLFHTHPKKKSLDLLSLRDIKNFMEWEQFGCLGSSSTKSNKIICHSKSSGFDKYKNEEQSKFNKMLKIETVIHKQGITEEERKEISKMSNREFDEYIKNFDDVIKYTKYFQNKYLDKVELI